MSLELDYTADFFTLDNLRSLTLRVPGQADVVIPKALGQPADWKDPDTSAGNVLEGDQVWEWPIAFSQTQPPLGALLIDPWNNAWTILSVTRTQIFNTWTAHCRNLSVVYNLNNRATVLKASYAKSPGGEALAQWAAVLENVPARFQPFVQDARILEDAEWPKTTYHVFLGLDIFAPEIPVEPASADYRLLDSAGRHFRIMSYQRPERIDVLPLAECVLIIEGADGGAIDRLGSSSSGVS